MRSRFSGARALLVVIFALAVAAQSSGQSFDLSGDWKTRFGPIAITQTGQTVSATFQWREAGEFTGRIDGVWLSGHWKTNSASSSGTWRLEIITGANRLAGKSIALDGGEILNFDAVRAELLTRRPSRDIAPVESNSSGGDVTGSWAASLGEFTLRQEGKLLTGLFSWDNGGRLTGRRDAEELRGEWYGRDGTSAGRWQARVSEKGQLLAGVWFDDAAVQNWTARRTADSGQQDDAPPLPIKTEAQDRAFTGEWRSRFGSFRLTEALHMVTGGFEWDGGGTLTGTVVAETASGKWLSKDGSKAGTWTLRSLPGGRILQGRISTSIPEQSSESWTAVRNK